MNKLLVLSLLLSLFTSDGSKCYYRDWEKVFYVTAESNIYVGGSFEYGELDPDGEDIIATRHYYRDPKLDNWEGLGVQDVKLVLTKNQVDVVTMVFDGRETNITSWFSVARLKSSPWEDMNSSITAEFFVTGGFWDFSAYVKWTGCDNFFGWMMVVYTNLCSWDINSTHPLLFYSNESTKLFWKNSTGENADSLSVFIRREGNYTVP